MTRILLADDHDIVRRGLRNLLETHRGWQVCGEAADGFEAVAMARERRPEVVVVDLSMPGLDGLEVTRRIRQELPETEVLVFSVHDLPNLVRDALAAGARGYVLKSDPPQEVIAAVEAVLAAQLFLSASVMNVVVDAFRRGSPGDDEGGSETANLSGRERQIVRLLAEGHNNREIAELLSLSTRTIETHRAAIFQKLGVTSIAELVRFAVRTGLIEP